MPWLMMNRDDLPILLLLLVRVPVYMLYVQSSFCAFDYSVYLTCVRVCVCVCSFSFPFPHLHVLHTTFKKRREVGGLVQIEILIVCYQCQPVRNPSMFKNSCTAIECQIL
uniref:Uncharacterized protein n=1 Tax=Anopheles darlingi TaxID=43151 RepID=A0A2M4DGK8_ANODA